MMSAQKNQMLESKLDSMPISDIPEAKKELIECKKCGEFFTKSEVGMELFNLHQKIFHS